MCYSHHACDVSLVQCHLEAVMPVPLSAPTHCCPPQADPVRLTEPHIPQQVLRQLQSDAQAPADRARSCTTTSSRSAAWRTSISRTTAGEAA